MKSIFSTPQHFRGLGTKLFTDEKVTNVGISDFLFELKKIINNSNLPK